MKIESNNRKEIGKKTECRRYERMMDVMEKCYLISEAAKLVGVESHVLRYWEEELGLPIRRNELGHRFYTEEEVRQLTEIKRMKEQGLQLKAIRAVMEEREVIIWAPEGKRQTEGAVEVREERRISQEESREESQEESQGEEMRELAENDRMQKESKALRLQILLHSMISQAVQENNESLLTKIRESNVGLAEQIRDHVIKELDYQFRVREEEQERREQERLEREEEHYRQLDERLREYTGRSRQRKEKSGILKKVRQRSEKDCEKVKIKSGSEGKEEDKVKKAENRKIGKNRIGRVHKKKDMTEMIEEDA